MDIKKIFVTIIVIAVCQGVSIHAAADDKGAIDPEHAALTWLSLVDDGNYGESWETAAAYFKNAVEREKWKQMLNAVRKPLGSVISRELLSKTYTKSLPGAPDGEYTVIQFKTSFGNKASGIETVTPMRDPDGTWRVSGYFIK